MNMSKLFDHSVLDVFLLAHYKYMEVGLRTGIELS